MELPGTESFLLHATGEDGQIVTLSLFKTALNQSSKLIFSILISIIYVDYRPLL